MGTKGRRWIKTRAKEAFEVKKAELKAQEAVHKRKPLEESMREHIGKMIDRIDPLESVAVIGTTIIIKTGINWGQEVFTTGLENIQQLNPVMKSLLYLYFPPYLITEVLPPADKLKEASSSTGTELLEWILSFTAGYLLVHNFGLIIQGIGQTAGSVVGLAKGLLGIGAVAA